MISVSPEFDDAIKTGKFTAYDIVTIFFKDSPRYLTDAYRNITRNGIIYNNSSGYLGVTPPESSGIIDRGFYQFRLADPNNVWRDSFFALGYGTRVLIETVIPKNETELIDGSLVRYDGEYLSSDIDISTRTGENERSGAGNPLRSRELVVTCSGFYPRVDQINASLSTPSVQKRFDPTDTCFDLVEETNNDELRGW